MTLKATPELVEAAQAATCRIEADDCLADALNAVLPLVEKRLRSDIATRIQLELICADCYAELPAPPSQGPAHITCFWAWRATIIAEENQCPS